MRVFFVLFGVVIFATFPLVRCVQVERVRLVFAEFVLTRLLPSHVAAVGTVGRGADVRSAGLLGAGASFCRSQRRVVWSATTTTYSGRTLDTAYSPKACFRCDCRADGCLECFLVPLILLSDLSCINPHRRLSLLHRWSYIPVWSHACLYCSPLCVF